ncbi:MAG: translation elongation factor 4 [Planctomycetes bacterium]|nr:translation elongation factor 4 [Planctomycetota bacterium]
MQQNTRNFCITAHIDHGKSTLADRLLQLTRSVPEREFHDLMLDDMELERERGITIKASCVTMFYEIDGQEYRLNLIDTPGHVDFSYEVSRALTACEGAVLLVDASQGIEAQTVVNYNHAKEEELIVIPAVTKIDLPTARPIETMDEMHLTFDIDPDYILAVSGKTGEYVKGLIKEVIRRVPSPSGDEDGALRALVFDSFYDEYRGVVIFVRIVDGELRPGDIVRTMGTGVRHEVSEVGIFRPGMTQTEVLSAGDVGYVIAGIKNIRDVQIGDTITRQSDPAQVALPGYQEPQPVVYSALYPQDNDDFPNLRSALDKLSLNDSSFDFEPESSSALGFGFRCGFLGLLHMEIVQERLERESDVPLVQTAPNVPYEIVRKDGEVERIDRPSEMPGEGEIEAVREPWVNLQIIAPGEHIGNVMKLVESRRGEHDRTEFFSDTRAMLKYEMPLAEIIYNFFDRLKSLTRGHGTMDYEQIGYRQSNLVKVDILVNESPVDALSFICHRDEAERRGRKVVKILREHISRHLFPIPLQAAIGSRVVARETIPPMKKNVTAKCYGGDITRKRKLWKQQKEGKKRMKAVGNVNVPQKAFLAVLEGEEID